MSDDTTREAIQQIGAASGDAMQGMRDAFAAFRRVTTPVAPAPSLRPALTDLRGHRRSTPVPAHTDEETP